MVISSETIKANTDEIEPKTRVVFIRAYGADNENNPPIVLIRDGKSKINPQIGEEYITIEFDVDAPVSPSLYVKFIHCSADWQETDNIFLNDFIKTRTTLFDWQSAPIGQNFYSYRGKIKVPNQQVKFEFAGNWKAKIFDIYNDEKPLAETRFFVVKPKIECEIGMYPEFYESQFPVSTIGLTIEGICRSRTALIDGNVRVAAVYKNHRWYEPYFISDNSQFENQQSSFRYSFNTWIRGFLSAGMRFRIQGLPAENSYRILNLAELGYYPPSVQFIKSPFADLRRNGNFWDYDDDGAMITDYVPFGYEDYVPFEFQLDPEGNISREEVFVVGSFNNWKPSADWQMIYDEEERMYKLRQWLPRARHNYLYATGSLNIDDLQVEKYSYDEFEGNTTGGRQSYLLFVYYREYDYGGYDSIIGVTSSSILSAIKR